MKQVKIIALFLVLVFFPLGSWIYLQKGLDFRKALGKELEVKGVVSDFISTTEGDEIFKNKTSLIILPTAHIRTEQVDAIYDQFKQAYTFQLVNGNRSYDGSEFSGDKEWLNQNLEVHNRLLTEKAAVIVDHEMQLRNYFGNSDAELKALVQQLSISFPKRPERDIVEKKDIENNE